MIWYEEGDMMEKYKSLKGYYKSKLDSDIQIVIERDYQKKSTVDFFYFMCKRIGGGTISKEELLGNYIKCK